MTNNYGLGDAERISMIRNLLGRAGLQFMKNLKEAQKHIFSSNTANP